MRRHRRAVLVLTLSLFTTPQRSHAILGVGDVTIVQDIQGYAQQLKDYAQQVEMYKNQVAMVQNQAKSLLMQAQNMKSLPVSLVNDLTNSIRDYNAILQGASGLSYRLSAVSGQFTQLYGSGTAVGEQLKTLAAQWTGQVQAAAASAVQAQAVSDKLTLVQARLGTALSLSDAANGTKEVQQAGNTLLGLVSEQQAALLELQATTARLEASVLAEQAAKEAMGRQLSQQWLSGPMPTYYPPGQTTGGVDLPTMR